MCASVIAQHPNFSRSHSSLVVPETWKRLCRRDTRRGIHFSGGDCFWRQPGRVCRFGARTQSAKGGSEHRLFRTLQTTGGAVAKTRLSKCNLGDSEERSVRGPRLSRGG